MYLSDDLTHDELLDANAEMRKRYPPTPEEALAALKSMLREDTVTERLTFDETVDFLVEHDSTGYVSARGIAFRIMEARNPIPRYCPIHRLSKGFNCSITYDVGEHFFYVRYPDGLRNHQGF